jgi:hypothetical protein
MMQHRAEMPKSVGQGVSLGTKQVPASGLVLPAAVWVTGQREVLVNFAVADGFGGDFLSVNITFVCNAGIWVLHFILKNSLESVVRGLPAVREVIRIFILC